MVRRKAILEFSRRLAEQFNPEKIILFGSRAYGKPHRDSDVDLLVIMPRVNRPIDDAARMVTTLRPSFSVDLILRTPRELARQYLEFDPLAREVIDRGEVLYERNPQGVDRKSRRRFPGGQVAHARSQTSKLRRGVLSRAAVH